MPTELFFGISTEVRGLSFPAGAKNSTPIDETLHILDGDRIAILMAEFLSEHINKSKLGTFNIGIVQTAYANRASTDYIKNVLVG